MKRLTFQSCRWVLPVLAVLMLLAETARAQGPTGRIEGFVRDEQGAVLPGVTVTVRNQASGVTRTVVTEPDGRFAFPALAPGNYTLSATLPGFQTKNLTGITLGQGTQYRFNFELSVSGVNTQVEVSIAADTILATSGATITKATPPEQGRTISRRCSGSTTMREDNTSSTVSGVAP